MFVAAAGSLVISQVSRNQRWWRKLCAVCSINIWYTPHLTCIFIYKSRWPLHTYFSLQLLCMHTQIQLQCLLSTSLYPHCHYLALISRGLTPAHPLSFMDSLLPTSSPCTSIFHGLVPAHRSPHPSISHGLGPAGCLKNALISAQMIPITSLHRNQWLVARSVHLAMYVLTVGVHLGHCIFNQVDNWIMINFVLTLSTENDILNL